MAINILTVGDVHGTSLWKTIDIDKYDKVVFLGDYVDPYAGITNNDAYNNFKDIIEFAKSNLNKVSLLIGNHDAHYILLNTQIGNQIQSSRFSSKYAHKLHELYMDHIDMFFVSYQFTNHLWTHAGISNKYYKTICNDYSDVQSISDYLNQKWINLDQNLFDIGYIRGGRKKFGGILWADILETKEDPLQGYHQIVGHSRIDNIFTNEIDKNTSITYVDCPNIKYFHETII